MSTSIYPKFCLTNCQQWPFLFPIEHIAISYCQFNKDNFNELDFEYSQIELPNLLQKAINKRKAEYLAGRICAREALKLFHYSGYPSLQSDKSPFWPTPFCGSISHSHTLAAAIVAQKKHWQNLGLDIEQILDKKRSSKLLNVVTNHREQKLFTNNISLFTTLAFSIKESLFKALYPLTYKHFYFEHAEIIEWSPEGTIILKLLIDLSEKWQKGQQIIGQFCIKNNYIWSFIGIPNTNTL